MLDAGVGKIGPGLIMAALVINKAQRHFLVSARHLALSIVLLYPYSWAAVAMAAVGFLAIECPDTQIACPRYRRLYWSTNKGLVKSQCTIFEFFKNILTVYKYNFFYYDFSGGAAVPSAPVLPTAMEATRFVAKMPWYWVKFMMPSILIRAPGGIERY